MSIVISEIKNQTLLKYAQEADIQKDGILDANESISLFGTLKAKQQTSMKYSSDSKKDIAYQSVLTGLFAACGLSMFCKSCRSLGKFTSIAIGNIIGAGMGLLLRKNYYSSKLEDIDAALKEYKNLTK